MTLFEVRNIIKYTVLYISSAGHLPMKWIHKLIFALSICTISLVALYSVLGDTRKLVITPEQFNIYATKDASEGGLSSADITYDAQSLVLNCELKKAVMLGRIAVSRFIPMLRSQRMASIFLITIPSD